MMKETTSKRKIIGVSTAFFAALIVISLLLVALRRQLQIVASNPDCVAATPQNCFLSWNSVNSHYWKLVDGQLYVVERGSGWSYTNGFEIKAGSQPSRGATSVYYLGQTRYSIGAFHRDGNLEFLDTTTGKWMSDTELGVADPGLYGVLHDGNGPIGVTKGGYLIKNRKGNRTKVPLVGGKLSEAGHLHIDDVSGTFAFARDTVLDVYGFDGILRKSTKLGASSIAAGYLNSKQCFYSIGRDMKVTFDNGTVYSSIPGKSFADIYSVPVVSSDGNFLVVFGPFGQSEVSRLIPDSM